MVFFIFLLCGFTSAISTRTLDPLTVALSHDLSVSTASVAMLASAMALPYALVQPVLGSVGDHFGKNRILKISLWATGLFLLASAFAPNFETLLVLRPLTGVAAAGVIPVAMAMIGDIYPPSNRQTMIARFVTSAMLGQLLGAVFAGMVEPVIGWRGVILICAAVALASAAMATGFLPDAGRPQSKAFSSRAALRIYGGILRNPVARVCYGTAFIIGGMTFGVLPHIAPILASQNNGGVREAGFIIAGLAIGSMVLSVSIPIVLRLFARPAMIITGGVILCLAFIAYSFGFTWPIQVGIMAFVGIGFFMVHNSIQAEVSEIAPNNRATAFSGHAFSFFLGQTLGPIIWGAEIAAIGAAAAAVVNGIGILCVALFAGFFFARLRPSLRR